ncbi:Leucine-rich repeat 3 [Arabidopsis thaliana x Arabidopsis arenosa]|uniref:ADP-ribosyl cyclase/cyclic ADP-ribose hydrolase n=1 Tax=Arabidopsis thaliana x Arabidopsis arenosa TaxID=1240361 RepID=A0A8T2DV72_9BRAS|nr:Leucine-rich repeat 3 [Arabidopsis thaliana x Arabidopsis arenosa]
MASSSSNSWRYDVFPSFRGEDVRNNFLSHLLKEFESKGIVTFRDDHIERSHTIGHELRAAIRESKISVVLFSENYASSSWCLDELVEIMKCKDEQGLKVMPVFYKVDPSDIRKQTGKFGMSFLETCCGKTEERQHNWRRALTDAANILGDHPQDWDNEAYKITTISKDVLEKLNATPSKDFNDLIGMEAHIAKMESLLCLESQGVRIVGIWGPAGVEERLKSQKVLIILDDVDNIEQLKALAKESQWFGNKSRIVVTTQNKQLLVSHDINHMYQVAYPSKQEALTIFCQHAFKQSSPSDDLKHLAIEFTTLAGHLPLALRVLGSFMRGKGKEEWEFSLPTLKSRLDGEVEKVLKVGYDGLHDHEKDLFLHIACIFSGQHENYLKQMIIANNDTYVSFGLQVLADKSLIQKFENGRIEMHSLLRQLGKEVVRKQSIYEPGKRQFLMNAKETCGVLSNNTGTGTVLGISLDMCEIKEELYISEKTFEEMRNLLYLKFYMSSPIDDNMKVKLKLPEEGLSYLPQLRLLHWDAYPLEFFPSRFRPECLVELNMSQSKLKKLWSGVQPLRNLTRMNLNSSRNLEILPNLMEATKLKTLDLGWCESLVELPSSIKNLQHLSWLEMSCCKKLEIIPTNINLPSLEVLHFRDCTRLQTFPEISTNLRLLKIKGTAITEVPPSVSYWSNIFEICMERTKVKRLDHVPYDLEILCLRGNIELESIPRHLNLLPLLQMIDISYCINIISLPNLPGSVSALTAVNCKSLQRLDGHFRNRSISLNFINCIKLDRRAQDMIHQSIYINQSPYKVDVLPGDHLPAYFSYQSIGSSIMIHSDNIDLSKFNRFKVCLVLGAGKSFEGCDIKFYKRLFCKPREYYVRKRLDSPLLKSDHLCMCEFELMPPHPPTEWELLHPNEFLEVSFESRGYLDKCEVKECGLQFLEPHETSEFRYLSPHLYLGGSWIGNSSSSIEEIIHVDQEESSSDSEEIIYADQEESSSGIEEIIHAEREGTNRRKSVMRWIKVGARKMGLSLECLKPWTR